MRTPKKIFISGLVFVLPAVATVQGAFAANPQGNVPAKPFVNMTPPAGQPQPPQQPPLEPSQTPPQQVTPPVRQTPPTQDPSVPFKAFTGKVTKNKVRLRHQPNLDSAIIKELNHGDLLIVTDESDDFYAVQAPAGLKAYVFRTYILDNAVEGSHVNVRLAPDVEAPVIGQLSGGDKVNGTISATNNKWLEIQLPSNTRFYVAKDYVEKIGDPSLLSTIEKRKEEVNTLLNTTREESQKELQKAFPEVNLEPAIANLNKIINRYTDFPEQTAKAKEFLETLQDNYLQKKLSYLEAKSKMAQSDWESRNAQLNEHMQAQQQRLSQLEQQLQKEKNSKTSNFFPQNVQGNNTPVPSNKMEAWVAAEQAIYENWSRQNDGRSMAEFYQEQGQNAVALTGIIEPYTRVVKNRPGDYILVNQSNNLPIAFLYSTQVNLQNRVGHGVTVYGIQRPNNNFAFPAYFVLSVE